MILSCGELSADDLSALRYSHAADKFPDAQAAAEAFRNTVAESTFGRNRSQLNVIFEVMGTPSEEDLTHVDDSTALLLKNLVQRPGKVLRQLLREIFSSLIDLRLSCSFGMHRFCG